jgi:hypothetical protein
VTLRLASGSYAFAARLDTRLHAAAPDGVLTPSQPTTSQPTTPSMRETP